MITTILVATLTCLLLCKVLLDLFRGKTPRIPKVTPRWPIVGNALHLDLSKIHLVLTDLASKYGPIYEFKMYNEVIVVLNDYRYISEALITKSTDFAGRPQMSRTDYADRNRNSLVWQTYTPHLVFLRKEVISFLRPFGAGSTKLEEKCYPEIISLISQLRSHGNDAVEPWDLVFTSVANMMLSVLIGKRMDPADQTLINIKYMSTHFNQMFGAGEFRELDFVPWKQNVNCTDFQDLRQMLQKRDLIWDELTGNGRVTQGSVIGQMLGEVSNCDVTSNTKEEHLTPTVVKECFTNLILAGTDTTATAITCLILVLVRKPEVQRKIQEEIDDVIGCCVPKLEHKSSMPYTQAVLLELLRYISHIPLAIPHCSTSGSSLGPYQIPKDRTVYINLWAMHHDPTFWRQPWSFLPERFLDDSGSLVPCSHDNRRRLMPFGAGRRVCIGERLAQARLFLFVTSLLQNLTFHPEDPGNLPDMDPRTFELGIVLHPKPFKIRTKSRENGVSFHEQISIRKGSE